MLTTHQIHGEPKNQDAATRGALRVERVPAASDDLTVHPGATRAGTKLDIATEGNIRRALARNTQVEAANIDVRVHGTHVTLSGDVRSWSEKQQAGRAAWASAHVNDVYNRLYVKIR